MNLHLSKKIFFVIFFSFNAAFSFEGLTIIGEGHYETGSEIYYPQLLIELKNKSAQPFCLLAEYPAHFLKNNAVETNFYKILDIYRAPEELNKRDLYEILFPFFDDAGQLQDPTLVKAYKEKLPIYFIDLPNVEQNRLAVNRIDLMNMRDAFMAYNINMLWQKQNCKSGLLINGALHITSLDPERVTLKQLLEGKNVPVRYWRSFDTIKKSKPLPGEGSWSEYEKILKIPN